MGIGTQCSWRLAACTAGTPDVICGGDGSALHGVAWHVAPPTLPLYPSFVCCALHGSPHDAPLPCRTWRVSLPPCSCTSRMLASQPSQVLLQRGVYIYPLQGATICCALMVPPAGCNHLAWCLPSPEASLCLPHEPCLAWASPHRAGLRRAMRGGCKRAARGLQEGHEGRLQEGFRI